MTEIAYAIQTGTDDEGRALYWGHERPGVTDILHAVLYRDVALASDAERHLKGVARPILLHDLREPLVTEALIMSALARADITPMTVKARLRLSREIDAAIRKRAEEG